MTLDPRDFGFTPRKARTILREAQTAVRLKAAMKEARKVKVPSWKRLPTFPISTDKSLNPFGFQLRHDTMRDKWHVLQKGSLVTNDVFDTKGAALDRALAMSAAMGTKLGEQRRRTREAEAMFWQYLSAGGLKDAAQILDNEWSRAISHVQVILGKKDAVLERGYRKARKALVSKIKRVYPKFETLQSWMRAGGPGSK